MTFLHPGLLMGLAAVAIPLILHFLLKQKPRKLLFPALRLIEQRRRESTRRLRLKQFWLLVLRMLVFGLIVFAIARPSMPPADYSLSLTELITLVATVALAVGAYFFILSRWRRQRMPLYMLRDRQTLLRGWTTGATLLVLLAVVGCPYQQRIAAEIRDPAPSGQIDLPVAGVLLFDASLSMTYQQEGKTYLDRARELARNHLASLPPGSKIAVCDTSNDHPVLFQSTLPAAVARIEALQTKPVTLALNDRLRDAIRAHEDDMERTMADQGAVAEENRRDRFVRRIYVLSDMAASAWRQGGSQLLRAELEKLKSLNLYLLDISDERPRNLAITGVELSRERIPSGGELVVSTTLEATGMDAGEQTLELYIHDAQGQPSKMGQVTVRVESGTPVRTEFPVVKGIQGPTVQGDVRLTTSDPLTIDNARMFAADVADPPRVLVLAPSEQTALPWMAAMAPFTKLEVSRNKFAPEFVPIGRLAEQTLANYSAVCLVNVPRLTDDAWFQLGKYVENGGGLAVFLGSADIAATSYERGQAQQFLPGRLDSWQPENDWRFVVSDKQHPLFRRFRLNESFGSFAMFENDVAIYRFWKVEPSPGATVVARYSDAEGSAAILERAYGRGRTVMVTTGVDFPENYRERWNNMPSTLLPSWLFIAFAEQMIDFTSRSTDAQHNFVAGDKPVIRIPPTDADRDFLLQQPEFKQSRQSLAAREGTLTLEDLQDVGHYRLNNSATSQPVTAFTINPAASESDLTQLTQQQLDDLLGPNAYQLARGLEELKDQINASDLGKEVFPVVLVLLLAAFIGEHLVANRFYESDPNQENIKENTVKNREVAATSV